jgi:hypothetical protein
MGLVPNFGESPYLWSITIFLIGVAGIIPSSVGLHAELTADDADKDDTARKTQTAFVIIYTLVMAAGIVTGLVVYFRRNYNVSKVQPSDATSKRSPLPTDTERARLGSSKESPFGGVRSVIGNMPRTADGWEEWLKRE